MNKQFEFKGKIASIRSYQDKDLNELIEVGKDERIWEYYKLGGNCKAEDIVSWEENSKAKNNYFDFVIIENTKNKIIGYTGVFHINQDKKTGMIGSTFIHSDYWGKGHNQESKKMIIDFAFKELGLEKLKYVCNVLNKNSYFAALKLGFELIKIEEKGRENTDGTWADFAHFELCKNVP
jgi:RimJ/RimL family protein N-acetyltransferase